MDYTSDPAIDGVIAALELYKGAYGPTIAIRCIEELKAERNAMRCDSQPRAISGMTLRDWFAGQALASLCNAYNDKKHAGENAEIAYANANAMLKQREVPNG